MHQRAVFTPELGSVRSARRWTARILEVNNCNPELAVLLVSELATNAVLHARTDFAISIHLDTGKVRVEVQDANERPPIIGHTPPEATSGRGLHLLQALSDAWGVESRTEGKIVWFEVPSGHDREDAFAS